MKHPVSSRLLVIHNQGLAADLVKAGWTAINAAVPKIENSTPGVRKGAFVHPITGAECDPDVEQFRDWAVFPSKGAIYKRTSSYLVRTQFWDQLSAISEGRWHVFLLEEASPDIPDDFDWGNASLLPYLPKSKALVLFERDEDAVLFKLLSPACSNAEVL